MGFYPPFTLQLHPAFWWLDRDWRKKKGRPTLKKQNWEEADRHWNKREQIGWTEKGSRPAWRKASRATERKTEKKHRRRRRSRLGPSKIEKRREADRHWRAEKRADRHWRAKKRTNRHWRPTVLGPRLKLWRSVLFPSLLFIQSMFCFFYNVCSIYAPSCSLNLTFIIIILLLSLSWTISLLANENYYVCSILLFKTDFILSSSLSWTIFSSGNWELFFFFVQH